MKYNYLFTVEKSGIPLRFRLAGGVHQFNISKDAQYYIRREAVKARHAKMKLLIISSDVEENIESIRGVLDRMNTVEVNQFINENEVKYEKY